MLWKLFVFTANTFPYVSYISLPKALLTRAGLEEKLKRVKSIKEYSNTEKDKANIIMGSDWKKVWITWTSWTGIVSLIISEKEFYASMQIEKKIKECYVFDVYFLC